MIDVLRHFRNFYTRNAVNVDSISQREFGIGTDKKINYRHKAFSNQREFQNFLVNEPPRFISHSVGRFEFPWAQPMEKKTLLSADLIFDLDAKPEAEGHSYIFCSKCVETAKADTIRLIEDFLLPDFGMSKGELLVVFSGSKGFHIHIRSQPVQQLSSTSRRLLVDYITGKELTVQSLAPTPAKGAKHLSGPDKSTTGWKKHFLDTALQNLDNAELFTKKKAAYIAENKARLTALLEEGNWDPVFHNAEDSLEKILGQTVQKYAVQVDSPVTFDVHRLIRIPGTLHGDTGLVAKPLSLVELAAFNPTKHAAAFTGTAAVSLKEPANVEFAGQNFELKAGENAVPLALAILLTCKGAVTI